MEDISFCTRCRFQGESEMPKVKRKHEPVQKQITEFEQQNPKIAEALRIFGITMTKYQDAINAAYAPRVYQSNSTTLTDKTAL